jgi:LPPG:FO 2-phospho-L-lactate transferase
VRVTVLSGGVGGARFLRGLISVVESDNVTIIGNVADDLEILGLHVSPDLDSVLYALAGVADEERGWGRADETWNALTTAADLGGEAWFNLGDRDLGLHLVRTQALREGLPLSVATARLANAFGLRCALLPCTDDPLRTFVETEAGTFPFQTWFVARGHRDDVDAVHYAGAPAATPAPGVLDALAAADVILITPSNPYVSIGPILSVEHIRTALQQRTVPCIAVSPLIGGRAVKGPADRMLRRLAGGTRPEHIAQHYPGLIDALVFDEADAPAELPDGIRPVVARTLMSDEDARRRLAQAVLDAAGAPA